MRPFTSILVATLLFGAPFAGFAVDIVPLPGDAGGTTTKTNAERRRLFFSREEITRAHEIAAEEDRARAALLKAHAAYAYEIIELAPFIVEGDNSLLVAAIRRNLELGRESLRQRMAELAPRLTRQAVLSGRASDRFFATRTGGVPSDAPEVFRITPESVNALRTAVSEFLENMFNQDARD